MKMMSVMRDIYADIPGYGKHKINSAYALGDQLLHNIQD
jgi:anionic cell wall polymer biosynthesis LytR-Cps2A-Psr (LCP) family protein